MFLICITIQFKMNASWMWHMWIKWYCCSDATAVCVEQIFWKGNEEWDGERERDYIVEKNATTSCHVHDYLAWHESLGLMLFGPFLTTIAFSMLGNLSAEKNAKALMASLSLSPFRSFVGILLSCWNFRLRNDMKATHIPCLSIAKCVCVFCDVAEKCETAMQRQRRINVCCKTLISR